MYAILRFLESINKVKKITFSVPYSTMYRLCAKDLDSNVNVVLYVKTMKNCSKLNSKSKLYSNREVNFTKITKAI